MKSALVTGDQGFLGRHFRAVLEARGWDVYGLDVKRSPSQDCREFFRSREGLRPARFDLVVHAAAVVGGRMKIDRAPLATAVNVSLDAEMFRWASVVGPGRVLYLSSSAAYPVGMQMWTSDTPQPAWSRLREEDVDLGWLKAPDQVYGWSKVVGEVLADKLRKAGVPVTVVRPFSGYGADQDDDYPFPSFVARARERRDPFDVWGPGTQVRDFIHVDDVVGGALAAVDAGVEGPLNLCTGVGTSFDELARLVCAVAGYAPALRHVVDAPVGVLTRVGNPVRMTDVWTPGVSLESGVRQALSV